MIICWSVLLRKQWVEHERFSLPLLQLQWICSNPRKRADQPFLQKLCNVDWVKSIPVVLHGLNRVTSLLSIHSESTCFLPIFQDTSPRSLFRIDIVAPRTTFHLPLRNRRCIPTETWDFVQFLVFLSVDKNRVDPDLCRWIQNKHWDVPAESTDGRISCVHRLHHLAR